jgi:hypothetical protein
VVKPVQPRGGDRRRGRVVPIEGVKLLVQLSKVVLCFEGGEKGCIRIAARASGVKWIEGAVRGEFGEIEVASENGIDVVGGISERSNF